MRAGRGPLCTKLRVATLSDAAVVRAATLRRGLSAGLGRARASEAARLASELATAIVSCARGGEILLDVDLEVREFWIVAHGQTSGLEALENCLRDGVPSGGRRASAAGPGREWTTRTLEEWSGEVKFESGEGGGTKVSCVIPLVRDGTADGCVKESEKSE